MIGAGLSFSISAYAIRNEVRSIGIRDFTFTGVRLATDATSLGLERDSTAFALVKASSVLVLVDFDRHKISARNCIAGAVSAAVKGAVNAEVEISVPEGAKIVSIMTNDSADRLGLAVGKPATAIFKGASVIVGVE
ncbi:transporter [Paraburkholderia dipogonis]|uniref:Transporter n=1 Tax=Paraburkholderia dipogonis TaxID=1211383 RepID=A0A4Y8MUD0_9BURK|nr:TOBE domain-containing protein [Paraburkholderia dipogonis]TFE41146.1 transporter [Paraburkholderia dipogonis]